MIPPHVRPNAVIMAVGVKQESVMPEQDCEMCDFMLDGFSKAHSRQAKADYATAYLGHRVKFHLTTTAEQATAVGAVAEEEKKPRERK